MVRSRFLFLFLLFGIVPLALDARETTVDQSPRALIRLTDDRPEINPGLATEILEDPGGQLTIEDVSAPQGSADWTFATRENLNLGFSASVFWLRLTIADESRHNGPWVLELNNPHIDYLQFYQLRDGRLRVNRTGDQLPFATREYDHRKFLFRLFTDPEPAVYYLRVQTGGAASLPLRIRSQSNVIAHLDREQMILGAYYGLMGIMMIYNIALFFSVRSAIYLYYVMYLTAYTSLFLAWNGLAFQYFWPADASWGNWIVPALITSTHLFGLQFTRSFLDTWRNARAFDTVMVVGMVMAAVLMLLAPFMPNLAFNRFLMLFTAAVVLLQIAVGILTVLRGVRAARFYVFAVGVVLVSALIALLRVSGLIEVNFWTQHCNQIGTAIQVALLSLALGDRINTMRSEREAARAEALENRRRADHLKDQFLSNISHELRTPLAEVYGYAEILMDEKDGIREDLVPMLESVHRASGRLSELIQDLMLLTSLDGDFAIEKTGVSLGRVLDESLEALRESISEGGLAVVRREELSGEVRGDPGLLCKAFYHVLKNAVYYNRVGGLIEIDLHEHDGRATLIVRDTGSGIPPEHIHRIWDKFHRVDSSLTYSVPGVGLGLFMTRRIVEIHEGRVAADSEPGVGSSFTITLPIEAPAAASPDD